VSVAKLGVGLNLQCATAAQKVELKADSVVHVGKVDAAVYPLAKKKTSYEFLREKAHLRPRTNTIGAFPGLAVGLHFGLHTQIFTLRRGAKRSM